MDKINCTACGAIAADRHRVGCPTIAAGGIEYAWDFSSQPREKPVFSDPGFTFQIPPLEEWTLNGKPIRQSGGVFMLNKVYCDNAVRDLASANFETPNPLRICSECGITIDEGSQHKSDCSFGLEQAAYLAAHPNALVVKGKRMSVETWEKIRDEALASGRGIIVEGCEFYYSILNAPSGPYYNGNFGKVPLSP